MRKIGKPYNDLTGRTFGRLTVTGVARNLSNRYYWFCDCSCGISSKMVLGIHLTRTSNPVRSCGCLRKETNNDGQFAKTHGMSYGPEYSAWRSAKGRCTNPNDVNWHNYGGRGIRMCDEWLDSFENFLAALGPRPEGGTLDRLDNSKGYEPDNCAWRTHTEQMRNRRTCRYYEWAGMTLTLSEWCERADVGLTTVRERLRRGWPWPQALYVPTGESYRIQLT